MTKATAEQLRARAIAGGITQQDIDACVRQWPYMAEDAWWLANAVGNPVRAMENRLDKLSALGYQRQAAQWTDEELRRVVVGHKSGLPVDRDQLAEACRRGMISMSSAMNSDF